MSSLPLCLLFLLCYVVYSQKIPRLKLIVKDAPVLTFEDGERPQTMFHDIGSDQVFIGGRGVLRVLTFKDLEVTPTQLPLKAEATAVEDCKRKNGARQADCDNFIRVVQRLDSRTIIICGTNAASPKCWFLANTTKLQEDRQGRAVSISGTNMCPPLPSQNLVAIAVEGNLYSALSGNKSSIGRSYGSKRQLTTEDKWLTSNPLFTRIEFVGAALLPEKDNSKDEIFFFYNEVNETAGLDDEPYKARLGRVCKVDEGSKFITSDSWTTFLKARLVCGHPNEPWRFHRLQDTFVLGEDQKSGLVLYGIFSSIWGTTAVCSYSMDRISLAFKTSKLKGFNGVMPQHRPGTCVPWNSPNAPSKAALAIIKDYQEIEKVIYPEGKHPLFILQNNDTYTRVVVDRMRDAANVSHDVLFLGTAKGKVHKVLPSGNHTVIIAELSPFKKEAPVSSMILDANTGHLYVSTEFEVTRLPLADCEQYRETCWKCVLARDPYCGWDTNSRKCSAVSQDKHHNNSSLLQSLDSQTTDVCEGAEEKIAQDALKKVSVDPTSYIYLPCPLRSHHAIYTWVKDDSKQYPCAMDGQSCTLRFGESAPMDQGVFKCTAMEEGYQEEITAYKVTLNSGRLPEVSLVVVVMGVVLLAITVLLL